MFILYLNPMQASNIENCVPVYRAETREELERFVESEKVEPYKDGPWHKTFRQGGPLEWYNPPDPEPVFFESYKNVGTLAEWMAETEQNWRRMLYQVLPAPALSGGQQ